MTAQKFKRRFLRDQQHAKRLKFHREGHTDMEIAICYNVHKSTICSWRTRNNLSSNNIIHSNGYKSKIDNRINLGAMVQK